MKFTGLRDVKPNSVSSVLIKTVKILFLEYSCVYNNE